MELHVPGTEPLDLTDDRATDEFSLGNAIHFAEDFHVPRHLLVTTDVRELDDFLSGTAALSGILAILPAVGRNVGATGAFRNQFDLVLTSLWNFAVRVKPGRNGRLVAAESARNFGLRTEESKSL